MFYLERWLDWIYDKTGRGSSTPHGRPLSEGKWRIPDVKLLSFVSPMATVDYLAKDAKIPMNPHINPYTSNKST